MTIYFTSGTTGAPKMTEHSHGSLGIGLGVNGRHGKIFSLLLRADSAGSLGEFGAEIKNASTLKKNEGLRAHFISEVITQLCKESQDCIIIPHYT